MPFDDRTFPSAEAAGFRRNRRRVAIWLFAVAYMIWGMVLLGGATRLTGSGLSIMEWAPISGALPPLSHAEWVRLFDTYKTIPQYALLHPGMTLDGFKDIFWLEWVHRAWGRLIGVVFLLPLIWFAATGAIERRALDTDLRKALKDASMAVAYQLQFDGDEVIGVEALARWPHAERGPIPPSIFIPLAEECGLIEELGKFVIGRAFADSRRWPGLPMSVNISVKQLRSANFVPLITKLLDEHGGFSRQYRTGNNRKRADGG